MATNPSQLPLELMQVDVQESSCQQAELESSLAESKETLNPAEHILQLFGARDYVGCLRAIDIVKQNTNFIILKASCFTHLGIDHEMVRQLLKGVLMKEPKNSFAHYELGLSLYINGDFEACLEPFATALRLNENGMAQAVVHCNNAKRLSRCFKQAADEFKKGNNTGAVETLSQAAFIDPENPSVVRKAKELIDSCLGVSPGNVDEELSCVEALIESNKLEEAAVLMPDDKNSARCWYLKALLSYRRAELVKASFYASKSLEFDPHVNSAECVRIAENAGKMIQLLDVASEQMKLQHNDCSIAMLSAALKIDNKNLRTMQAIYFQLAVAKHNSGMEAAALKDYAQFEILQKKSGWVVVDENNVVNK